MGKLELPNQGRDPQRKIIGESPATFWDAWSPYLADLEDNHLDVPTLNSLGPAIRDPVLVVGAGHGLLVEALRAKGFHADGIDFCREMIAYAAARRRLKLIHGDARALPFADEGYQTTIIATGVVDFLDEDEPIRRIFCEAARVTKKGGKVLAAFYKPHPAAERFLTRIGVITQNGRLRQRRIFELSRQAPWNFLATVRKDGNLNFLSALVELARMHFGLPEKERVIARKLAKILKSADNADELIQAVPESIPYRTEEDIRSLCDRLQIAVERIWIFDPCIVAAVVP